MQVHSRMQSSMYHSSPHSQDSSPHQNHAHSNGAHSDSRQYYSTSTNGHSQDGGDMNPYQQYPNPYAPGHGHPQQARQYPPNQLAPMHGMAPQMPPPPGPPLVTSVANTQPGLYPPQPPRHSISPGPGSGGHGPNSMTGTNGKYKFELRVEQQPQRARMCGFGDKDRRPITPPPCVRLIITDAQTGQPIRPDDMDGTFYVLQVDLWDDTATREVNLVRSSASSPAVSISSATTTSFPPTTPERPLVPTDMHPMYAGVNHPMFAPPSAYGGPGHPNMAYYPQSQFGGPQHQAMPYAAPMAAAVPQSASMFTRNLIGSLTVNASTLKDNAGDTGFWFVLQDLSVRTEGKFRLRMNFIDVGAMDGGGLNKGKAPVLAWTFSDSFQVYSAKKFPGVIESTDLSKKFAEQGIKIPIRKDVKTEGGADDDGE